MTYKCKDFCWASIVVITFSHDDTCMSNWDAVIKVCCCGTPLSSSLTHVSCLQKLKASNVWTVNTDLLHNESLNHKLQTLQTTDTAQSHDEGVFI